MGALQREVLTSEERLAEERWLDAVRIYLAPWYRKPVTFVAWWVPWMLGRRP